MNEGTSGIAISNHAPHQPSNTLAPSRVVARTALVRPEGAVSARRPSTGWTVATRRRPRRNNPPSRPATSRSPPPTLVRLGFHEDSRPPTTGGVTSAHHTRFLPYQSAKPVKNTKVKVSSIVGLRARLRRQITVSTPTTTRNTHA